MDRRSRRASVRATLTAAAFAVLAAPAPAPAQVTTDLVDWHLTESAITYGGGTQFHLSAGGGGTASFRWLDSPSKTTVISANGCMDGSHLGGATYGVGDTSYRDLYSGLVGWCFMVRGRTAIGSGSMVNHDGRVRR